MTPDRNEIKHRASGNWHGILTALGLPSESLTNKHQPCPACGGRDRFRFDDKDGQGTFICSHYQNGAGDGFGLLMHYHDWTFAESLKAVAGVLGMADNTVPETRATTAPQQPPKPPKDRLAKLAGIWNEALPLTDSDPVIAYLKGRGPTMAADYPQTLRYHPDLAYWAECSDGIKCIGRYPAMIAAITELSGELAGLHITYLKPCYSKPQGDNGGHAKSYTKLNIRHPETGEALSAKKMQTRFSGIGWLSGKAATLYPQQHNALLVCEGIESALAAHELTGWPVWACLSANSLSAFEWPHDLTALGIYADSDQTGIQAAHKLARRAKKAGLAVTLWQNDTPDTDALDELNAIRAAAQTGSIND